MSPVTELEQYLTERCGEKPVIEYTCKSVDGLYRQATVFAPLFGYIEGKRQRNQEKAERSAAREALKVLRDAN